MTLVGWFLVFVQIINNKRKIFLTESVDKLACFNPANKGSMINVRDSALIPYFQNRLWELFMLCFSSRHDFYFSRLQDMLL